MKNFQAHVEILLCLIKFILNEGALKWKKLMTLMTLSK